MTRKINFKSLQKKGLLTVLLIVLGESITLSNAVHFWSTYQNWSNHYGRGRFAHHHQQQQQQQQQEGQNQQQQQEGQNQKYQHSSHILHHHGVCTNNNQQECKVDTTSTTTTSSSTTSSSSSSSSTLSTSKLHPRQLARVAASVGKRSCSTTMYECCQTNCPSCIHLDIRGGHSDHNHNNNNNNIIVDTILSSASAATTITETIPTPYNIPLNIWKIMFQIFLTALNVACWLIPLRAKTISENKLALGLANAFSGGVFLTLAFGHLIPECVHGFEGMNEALPYMIVLAGYLLIFFVEKVAFDAHGLMHEAEHSHGSHGGTTHKNKAKVTVAKTVNGVRSSSSNKDEDPQEGLNVGRSAVILLGALAVHSILEMTALGLARSFGDSALLTLSIALHQVRFLSCLLCCLYYIVF